MKTEHVDALFESVLQESLAGYMEEREAEALEQMERPALTCPPELRARVSQMVTEAEKKSSQKPRKHTVRKLLRQIAAIFGISICVSGFLLFIPKADAWIQKFRSLEAIKTPTESSNLEENYVYVKPNEKIKRNTDIPDGILSPYTLPQGYHLEEVIPGTIKTIFIYINSDSENIIYEQWESEQTIFKEASDKEDAASITINGTNGYVLQNEESFEIIWSDGSHGYRISGYKDLDALIDMAKSVR